MKTCRSLYCCLLFVGLFVDAQAQNICTSQLTWNCNSAVNVGVGAAVEAPGYLISYQQDSVVWKNPDHTTKFKFITVEINGSWTNVNGTGSIVFEVQEHGRNGNIRFIRTSSSIEIRVLIFDPTSSISFEFNSQPPVSLP